MKHQLIISLSALLTAYEQRQDTADAAARALDYADLVIKTQAASLGDAIYALRLFVKRYQGGHPAYVYAQNAFLAVTDF